MERIEVNLLPAEYRIHSPRLRLRREIIYPSVFLLIVACFLAFSWINMSNKIHEQKSAIQITEQRIAEDKHIHNEISKLREEHSQIQNKIHALQKIDINRDKWVRLQEVFSSRLPDQTWLTAIEENSSGHSLQEGNAGVMSKVSIRGKTADFSEVAVYMSALQSSEYINTIDLSKVEQGTNKVFDFSISCVLNPDAQLDTVREQY
ncbi:MAG: PilN domain-containing protein [Fibrobacterota bacterium]